MLEKGAALLRPAMGGSGFAATRNGVSGFAATRNGWEQCPCLGYFPGLGYFPEKTQMPPCLRVGV